MGHVLGAEKGIFLIRGRGRPTVYGARAGGILSIPAQEVSLGSPRVGTIHVQAPTRMRRRSQHISANSLISAAHKTMNSLAWLLELSEGPTISACGADDYPLPDLPREASRGRSGPTKSVWAPSRRFATL